MGKEKDTGPLSLIRAPIHPPPDVVDPQRRRRGRLLSALLLAILVVGGASGLVQVLIVPGFLATFQVGAGALVALAIAYALARTKHYPAAAWIACLVPGVASYGVLLANPTGQTAFVFLLIGVLLSSMLLDVKSTLGLAGLNVIGLLALPFLQPAWTPSIVAGKLSFHILIPALIVLAMKQRDLVERDRREELLESESKFRSIFNSSVDAIGVSKVGIHITVNPAYLAMFGYESVDQLAGTPILDLIAPSERARVAENVRRRYEGEPSPANYETRGRRRDGAEFDMEAHVSTYDMGGEPHTVVVLRDITERKEVERVLQESERRFREMLQGVHLAGIMLDQTGRVTFINDFLLGATGWSREETLGRDWFATFIPPEIREKVRAGFDQVSSGGAPAWSYENEILTRSGERRLIHWSSAVLPDSHGRPIGAASIGEDITERRRLEENWRASEQRYRMLFEANPHPMWVYDLESLAFLTVNDAAIARYGYSREEFAGMTLRDIRPAEDVPRLLSHIGMPHPGIDDAGQWRHRLKDGTIIDVEITSHPLTFDGRAAELVLANNITERLRAQRDLEEHRRRLAFLLAKSPSVIYSARAEGDFAATFVSDNVTRQLGYQPQDFTADPQFWISHVHPEDAPRVLAEMEQLFLEGKLAYEYRFLNQEGRYIWMRDEMALVRDASGQPIEIVGAWIDVTAQRSSLREKDALLKEVHHRVKNNLQVIVSLLRLEAGRNPQPATRSVLKDMQGRIQAMALLHETLYRSSTFASVDLGAYLGQLAAQSFRAVNSEPGSVQLELNLASLRVEMDQAIPCGLILNELISNSLKHGFPGGRTGEVRVELRVEGDGASPRLCVSDTGVGLPPDLELRRARSLGLQIASDLARQLGGRLEVGTGPGARFDLTFAKDASKGSTLDPIRAPSSE